MEATIPCLLLCLQTVSNQCIEIFSVWNFALSFRKKIAQIFLQSHQLTEQCFQNVYNISVNLQCTEKVGLIILVTLTAHHTPGFTAHYGLSVIIFFLGGGFQCRWQRQRGRKMGVEIIILIEEYEFRSHIPTRQLVTSLHLIPHGHNSDRQL